MRTLPDAAVVAGRRRQTLETAFARLLKEDLENRVLDFDSAAATEAASLAATRRKMGRPVDMRDTQIAACGACYPKRSALFGSRDFYCRSFARLAMFVS